MSGRLNPQDLWFVHDEDYQTTPSQLYHENSKVGWLEARFEPPAAALRALEELQRFAAGKYKRYDYAPKIALPPPALAAGDAPLAGVLQQRRSRRRLAARPLDLAALSAVLSLAAGVTGELALADGSPVPVRAYPSAGGLYAVETYALALDVADVPRGVYHHDLYQSALDHLGDVDRAHVQKVFLGEPMVGRAGAVIVLSAVLPRLRTKYGERAYRYAHLEAGHLAQNILLIAQSLGLAAAPVGGFVERALEELIDADGVEEIALYSIFLGHPAGDTPGEKP